RHSTESSELAGGGDAKHELARVVARREVDARVDVPVVVVRRVVEDLAHLPRDGAARTGDLGDVKELRRAGLWTGPELFVLVEVRVEGLLPARGGPGCAVVVDVLERREPGPGLALDEFDAPEQCVADEDPQGARVGGEAVCAGWSERVVGRTAVESGERVGEALP